MFRQFGTAELLIVLIIILLVFGASRIPEIGAALGKGIRAFRRSVGTPEAEAPRPARPRRSRARTAPEEREREEVSQG